MKVNRESLLARLKEASRGLSSKEILEQSSSYVFQGGELITFNDNVMVRTKSPLDFDAAVVAAELTSILEKLPDDDIEITKAEGEIRVSAKRREFGVTCSSDVRLDYSSVPAPTGWKKIPAEIYKMLALAARTCGQDETQILTTCVHVTPELIEGCDNYRFFRATMETGFPEDVLIHASNISSLDGLALTKIAIGKGWVHFQVEGGAVVSLRSSKGKYHKDVDKLLEMDDPETITLPASLPLMVERAEVFNSADYDARIGVSIAKDELVLSSQKEGGWYKETKAINYKNRAMEFMINPKFLVDVLQRTRQVQMDGKRLRITDGAMDFVVALVKPTEKKKKEKDEG